MSDFPILENPEAVQELSDRLHAAGRFAFDTEANSFHAYFHRVCLMQLAAPGVAAIVDPLAVDADGLAPLLDLMADSEVRVVMHGSDYDLRLMDKDYRCPIRGLEDTQILAQLSGEKRTGLAHLLDKHLGVAVDKRYQKADWGYRPLEAGMIDYALGDVVPLLELADLLWERIDALGRRDWATQECLRQEAIGWEAPVKDPLAFERIKGARTLRGPARDRLAAIWALRESIAAEFDKPPFRIIPNHALMQLAEHPPRGRAGLAKVKGVGRSFMQRHAEKALELLREPPRAPKPAGRKARGPGLDETGARALKAMQMARDRIAEELGLEGGLLAPKAMLREVVEARPNDVAGLVDAGLCRWRAELLGDRLLAALQAGN